MQTASPDNEPRGVLRVRLPRRQEFPPDVDVAEQATDRSRKEARYADPMHPRTSELVQHLQQTRAALRSAVDAMPAALQDRKPAPDRWSVAEVLEHLGQVETQVTTLLDRGLRQLERQGLRPAQDHSPVLPTLDTARLLDRGTRLEAPPPTRPKNGLTAAQAWQVLEQGRAALQTTLLSGDGIDVDPIRAPHPFLGELTFHQWIAFVGLHEARHTAQILATAAELPRS